MTTRRRGWPTSPGWSTPPPTHPTSLAERGIDVDQVSVHRWVQRFAPLLADAARFGRHRLATAGSWTRPM
jgi:hypothetical protein